MPIPLASPLRVACVAALAVAGLTPAAAGAQADALILQGHVVDADGRTVDGARIVALGSDFSATAGDDGAFRLAVRPGRYLLRVRRLGYAPRTVEVAGAGGDTLDLALTLAAIPVELSAVLVEGADRRYTSKLAGFANRMRTSAAPASAFVTRDQIERRNPGRLTDLLPTADGRCSARTQRYTIWLDGILLAPDTPLDVTSVANVEAMEIYRSVSHVPSEYNVTLPASATAGCVVFVWTR